MGWWLFWKNRRDAAEADADEPNDTKAREVVAPPLARDAAAVDAFAFAFDFEKAPELAPEPPPKETLQGGAPPAPPEDDVAAVVRRKAKQTRPRGAGQLAARGITPVLVPSLREQALLYRLAAVERAAEAPERAAAFWRAYLELQPTDADAWFRYGRVELMARRPEQAWRAFERARTHDPRHGLAVGALGYLSGLRGDHEGAVRHYAEAVALRPECDDMRRGLDEARTAAGADVVHVDASGGERERD